MMMRTKKRTMSKMKKNLSCFSSGVCQSSLSLISHSLQSFLSLMAHEQMLETALLIDLLVDPCFVPGWLLVILNGQVVHDKTEGERGEALEEGRVIDVWKSFPVAYS